MNKDFILPDIGEGIVECEVIEWKVKEGDLIEEDQIVVDVSTDKAIVEIPSMYNGRVTKLYYQESDTAEVHKPLFAIEVEGEEQSRGQPEDNKQAATVAVPVMEVPVISAAATSDKVLTTPAVRKMAREHSLDLATIAGTGKQGRVLKEDVLAYLNQKAGKQTATVQVNSIQDRREPIKGVRKIMAERMADSVATIPHFTFIDEFDITELMGLRSDLVKNHGSDDLENNPDAIIY